ncbi:MAG: hypothetical protein ACYC4H_04740 [Desulfocucumaceae bacterium]
MNDGQDNIFGKNNINRVTTRGLVDTGFFKEPEKHDRTQRVSGMEYRASHLSDFLDTKLDAVHAQGSKAVYTDVVHGYLNTPTVLLVSAHAVASTEAGKEVDMEKVLPERRSIEVILRSLSPEEVKEFLRELYDVAVIAVRDGKSENIDELRTTLLSWEYTAIVKNNEDYRTELENATREIEEDEEPGVSWREFLRG